MLWCDCFVDNPASERVMHKCGFRDTGAFNLCSHLYLGDDRLVKIMRLDGSAYIETKLFAKDLASEMSMDKMAESGQFGTKDGHIGRDFRVGT